MVSMKRDYLLKAGEETGGESHSQGLELNLSREKKDGMALGEKKTPGQQEEFVIQICGSRIVWVISSLGDARAVATGLYERTPPILSPS